MDLDFASDRIRVKKRSISVKKMSQKTYYRPDLISNLPEFVIRRIFSFLPTKDVVRTCVLSRRWTYLWTSMKELSFDDKNLYFSSSRKQITKTSFVNSIYRVLLLLNSMSIHSFKLTISQIYDPYHINAWISALSIREVKKITLFFNTLKSGGNIPSKGLFKCHSLEELHLKSCVIQIPNVVSLSSLTVLKLERIQINTVGNPLNKLTLNLPSLKEYEQVNCNWNGVKTVSFEVPLLEVLWISDNSNDPLEMVFSAVSLRRLCYYGYELTHTIDLLAVHVASAEIFIMDCARARVQGMMNFVCKLVTANVERLKLYVKHPKDFAKMEYPSGGIPSFGRLVHLEVDNFPTKLLLDLLSKGPCLQTLILKSLYSGKESLNFAIVPDCFLDMIKVVKFERFLRDDHELNIAKFLMENAKVLERISFSYHCCFSNKDMVEEMVEEIKEELFSFKRRSSLALIEFECSS